MITRLDIRAFQLIGLSLVLLLFILPMQTSFLLNGKIRVPAYTRRCQLHSAPPKRPFLPLHLPDSPLYPHPPVHSPSTKSTQSTHRKSHSNLRVLQFNILADGLSGLREDLGAFSRVTREDLAWEKRRNKLLSEIIQYEPDIITLQECDHFSDFFLPKLSRLGYEGIFTPKPSSACLEVSTKADGCCIFVKRAKLSIQFSEVTRTCLYVCGSRRIVFLNASFCLYRLSPLYSLEPELLKATRAIN
jgi:hypothetical protein